MRFELALQDLFDSAPTIFKDRCDCLNHLFCVIGNGYHWYNGELIDDDSNTDEKVLESHLVAGKAYQHNKMSLRDEAVYYSENMVVGSLEELSPKAREVIEEYYKERIVSQPVDVYHRRPRHQRWYFYLGGYCTEHAYLFNYPADIKPDWLAGIEECKTMLREDGYYPDSPSEHPIDTQANFRALREESK